MPQEAQAWRSESTKPTLPSQPPTSMELGTRGAQFLTLFLIYLAWNEGLGSTSSPTSCKASEADSLMRKNLI